MSDWLWEESEISAGWLVRAFARKLQSGRFMFTLGRLLDLAGGEISRAQAISDVQREFANGHISVTSVAPISGAFAAVGNFWRPEEASDLTFIVAPRLKKFPIQLLEAAVEVFFIEQCQPSLGLIQEYLETIYGQKISDQELLLRASESPRLFVQGLGIYPSRAAQDERRRENFAEHPRYDGSEKNNLMIDERILTLGDFFISHFAGNKFSAIEFAVLVKLYGPEVFADAPAGLAIWFFDRAVLLGVLDSGGRKDPPQPPRTRVISVVPICLDAEPDQDAASPVASQRNDPEALLREQLLFVHCFKHELLAGQSVLLNQVNNLCRVRSGRGVQINFRAFGFLKLRDFLEDISGVKVNGDKHNMAVHIENIHAFAGFIAEARKSLGDESLVAGFETVDLPQLIPVEVVNQLRDIFASRENAEIPAVELLTNFKTHFMPADPLVYKRLGYRRIKDFVAALPNIKKLGSKGAAKYVWQENTST